MTRAWVLIAVVGACTIALKGLGPAASSAAARCPAPLLGVVALLAPTLLAALIVTQAFADGATWCSTRAPPASAPRWSPCSLRAPVLVVVVARRRRRGADARCRLSRLDGGPAHGTASPWIEWTTSAATSSSRSTAAPQPLRARIEQQLRDGVRAGRLHPGTRLPSTRALAARLGVARGVVVEAYAQLAAEGWVVRARARARASRRRRAAAGARAEPPAPGPAALRLRARGARPRARSRARLAGRARRALRGMPDAALGTATRAGAPRCAPPSPPTSAACAACVTTPTASS